jgi:hypothetical protein
MLGSSCPRFPAYPASPPRAALFAFCDEAFVMRLYRVRDFRAETVCAPNRWADGGSCVLMQGSARTMYHGEPLGA